METPDKTPEDQALSNSIEHMSLLFALSEGSTRSAACRSIGLGRRAFYDLLESDPIFNANVAAAEARAVDHMEGLAYTCADKAEEDPRYLRALFFWLKCRAGWVEARPMPRHSAIRSGDGYPHAIQASEGAWHSMSHEQSGPSPRVPRDAVAAPRNEPAPAHIAADIDPYEAMRAADAESDALARTVGDASEPKQPEASGESVPFVPSKDAPGEPSITSTCTDTPVDCPPLGSASILSRRDENPAPRVPSVPPENTKPETRNTKPPFRVPSVPSVPSKPLAASAQQSAPNRPASNNPKSAIQNPKSKIPCAICAILIRRRSPGHRILTRQQPDSDAIDPTSYFFSRTSYLTCTIHTSSSSTWNA